MFGREKFGIFGKKKKGDSPPSDAPEKKEVAPVVAEPPSVRERERATAEKIVAVLGYFLAEADTVEQEAQRLRDVGQLDAALEKQAQLAMLLRDFPLIRQKLQTDTEVLERLMKRFGVTAGKQVDKKSEFADTVRVTVEGEDRIFDPRKEVEQWKTFLIGKNPEYGKLTYPESFTFTAEQAARIKRYLELGMTQVVFVPNGLVDEPQLTGGKVTASSKQKAQALETLMSKGYHGKTSQGSNYATSGGIGASTGVGSGRFVFYKPVKELADDPQYAATIDKTMEELTTQKISTLKMPGFRADEQSKTLVDAGVMEGDEIAWLMLQREIFERTGEHIETNYYTFFPGSRRAESPALVPGGYWDDGRLGLDADVASYHIGSAGCRLAGRINL